MRTVGGLFFERLEPMSGQVREANEIDKRLDELEKELAELSINIQALASKLEPVRVARPVCGGEPPPGPPAQLSPLAMRIDTYLELVRKARRELVELFDEVQL